jgi:glycosyltransferase involved in cell wall biosynthesis
MRVLIDATFARRGRSGTAVYVERLSAALEALGVSVEHAAAPAHRYLNLPVEMAWTHGELPRRARGFDVLHHPLPALSRVAPCPQAVTVQDLSYLRLPECFRRRFRTVAAARHRAAARGADVLITPSESTAADVRSRWAPAAPLVVAPYGPGQEPPPNRGEARHFLYVGDDEPRKNLDRLLAAYQRYRDWPRGVRPPSDNWPRGVRPPSATPLALVLAGASARRAGAPGVRGEPEPDLADLHRHAAALVIPSLYEGFGLPALEAMHAGTPVIAGRTAGLSEVCGDAARLVDPRDPESICQALLDVGHTPPLREELRRRGTARAESFTWSECARRHIDAYTLAVA